MCVELRFLRENHRAGEAARHPGGARPRLRRHHASTAGRRPRSCRCRARATWRSSSSPCRRATTWPAGASASWSATRTWCTRWRASRATTTTAASRRSRWPRSSRSKGRRSASRRSARHYEKRRDVMVKGLHDIGWMVENPKASMYIWAKIPELYAKMGSIEFTKRLLRGGEDRGLAGHRLRRLRRRPRAHRADRERAPPAPGGARHPRDVPARTDC